MEEPPTQPGLAALRKDLDDLWLEIEQRMGVCPSFFKLAGAEPRVARGMFDLARHAYLESSPPALFKEVLFTYLSRFCKVNYCMTRHAGFLLGHGYISGDASIPPLEAVAVAALLSEPLPDSAELRATLETLDRSEPFEEWPDLLSETGRLIRVACAAVFLRRSDARTWAVVLRRLFGPARYEQLMLFLAFVRTAHFWTEVHPELHWEQDLEALVEENRVLERALRRAIDPEPSQPAGRLQAEASELSEALALMDALRESEERWKLTLEAADAGAWELNLRDHTAWRSLRHDQIFGYQEALPRWTYEQFLEHVVPEDRQAVNEAFESAVARSQDWRFECRINRADGEIRWIRVTGRISHGANRVATVMRGVVEDVTRQKRSEEALRAARAASRERAQLFRAVIDASPFPKIIHAEGGEILMMNRSWEALTGYRLHEIPTIEEWTRRAYGERHREVSEHIENTYFTLETMRPVGEYDVITASGAKRTWSFFAGPLGRDEQGRRLVLSTAADVTEQKQAEETLREADRAKDEFLALLGHELRNPLAPLRTGIDLMRQVPEDPILLETLHPMMDRQLTHLVRLVDDLLDISRVSRGKISLQRETLDIRGSVTAAVEQLKPLIEERHHELVLALTETPLRVHGDYERLTQVIANLLSNAAKYTERGGTITVSAAEENGEAVIRVKDTGYGIPPDRLGRLFKLFSQVPEHQAKTGGGGLGIGLALSRQLIDMHGGSINARSEGLDRGTEFTVRLPIHQETTDTVIDEQPRQAKQVARRVLIAEDNADGAEALRMLLELKGHTARAVFDGPAVLEELERFKPDVLLLDLGLPGMGGVEVARKVRAMPGGEDMLIVAVTGWGKEEDKNRTREAGFDAHLTKPLEIDQIMSTLAALNP